MPQPALTEQFRVTEGSLAHANSRRTRLAQQELAYLSSSIPLTRDRSDDWTIVICYGAVQFGDPRSRTSNSSFEMSLLFRVPFHASPPQATDSPWIQSSIGKSHVARESQALHQFPIEALPSFHRLRLPRKICTCDRDSVQIDCLMTIHRKYRCFDRPRPKITSFR